MDKALVLKTKVESSEVISYKDRQRYLSESELFNALLVDFDISVLNLLWRLTQLSEIPYSGHHHKVKNWLHTLVDKTYTGSGFSLNGKDDYLLACYNGMITSLLIKFGYEDINLINQGIDWILNYQNVKRGQKCNWQGVGLKKYGGCMKSTPCFIGLVKSMIGLSDYRHSCIYQVNSLLEYKLQEGLEYILNQKVYLKLSSNQPITKEIIKLTYPFTWKTNIIEVLRLLKKNNKIEDVRCNPAKEYLRSKMKKDGCWWAQSSNISRNKAWVNFDQPREKGWWIGYEIENLL